MSSDRREMGKDRGLTSASASGRVSSQSSAAGQQREGAGVPAAASPPYASDTFRVRRRVEQSPDPDGQYACHWSVVGVPEEFRFVAFPPERGEEELELPLVQRRQQPETEAQPRPSPEFETLKKTHENLLSQLHQLVGSNSNGLVPARDLRALAAACGPAPSSSAGGPPYYPAAPGPSPSDWADRPPPPIPEGGPPSYSIPPRDPRGREQQPYGYAPAPAQQPHGYTSYPSDYSQQGRERHPYPQQQHYPSYPLPSHTQRQAGGGGFQGQGPIDRGGRGGGGYRGHEDPYHGGGGASPSYASHHQPQQQQQQGGQPADLFVRTSEPYPDAEGRATNAVYIISERHSAQESMEISLEKGDRVLVSWDHPNGWLYGKVVYRAIRPSGGGGKGGKGSALPHMDRLEGWFPFHKARKLQNADTTGNYPAPAPSRANPEGHHG